MPHAVGLKEKACLLRADVQKLGKHAGGIAVREHMAFLEFDIGKAGRAGDLRQGADILQNGLLTLEILRRDQQGKHGRAGEGILDLVHGGTSLRVDKLGNVVVIKSICHMA